MAKAEDILKLAIGEIGVTEYPPNSNKVKYNKWFYGRDVQGSAYPWCCAFICWLFKDNPLLITKTASCSTMAVWFKKNNQWFTTPKTGDLVFYNFHHPNNVADHVGIVEKINANGSITAIEGNTSASGSQDNGGAVLRKIRKANIVGYGRPNYDVKKVVKEIVRPTLKVGCVGTDVKYLHQRLRLKGYGVDANNNKFNDLTKQCVMHFQAINALEIDGIVGVNTWRALEK